MRSNFTKVTLLICLLLLALNSEAQQWLGRTIGNYSGTYGVYSNAASLSDSKYKYYFNFWGRGVNIYNNYLDYNAPIKLNHWANDNYSLNYKDIDGNVDYQKDWLLENLNGKNKQFSFNQDIWGPAFMFPVSKHWNMSINTRQRSGLQMYGISEQAARLAFNKKMDSTKVASLSNGFGINAQTYQELSFTLGGILAKNDRHQLSGGATVKFIRGLGAAYLKGENMNLVGMGPNSAMINGDFQYAYTDQKSIIDPFNNPYGLFSLNSRGFGAGFDLGLSYTYRSKRAKYNTNKYCDINDRRSDHDFKLALAVNDIGGIRFNRMSSKYSYSSSTMTLASAQNSILDPFRFSNKNAFDSIGENVFAPMGATKSYGFSTALPSAVNLQMDFRITKYLYTSVFWNQSLKGHNSTGLRSTSMLSVVPRIESRGFEFSMPLTMSENYRNFYVGAYTRIGPVFFGSDNLGGLLNVASASNFSGADIYGGISFGIGHCHSWWYQNQVDPVYIDSTDSLRTELRDSIKIVERDTIILRDTVNISKTDTLYIEKIIKSKSDLEKEKELKKREEELNRKKTQLDVRERDILIREKNTSTDNEELKKCNDRTIILTKENTVLKDKEKTQNDAIIVANRRIAELELEVINLKKNCSGNKTNAEVIQMQKKVDSLNNIIILTRTDYELCKKNYQTNAEVVKKAENDRKKAENDAKIANRRADSLANILVVKLLELDNCKKNSTQTNAEIVKKAEQDKAKAENDARVARKQADSIRLILIQREKDLDICKKNSVQTNADVVKKLENDVNLAKKKSDSLIVILNQKNTELDNCKKNSTQTNAEVVKRLETEKAKAENDAKVAKKTSDSLIVILNQNKTELDNCKKNSTQTNAEVVKRLETEKAKAENDARVAKKTSDSLIVILNQSKTDLENCKKNSTQTNAEVIKKLEADKAKAENDAKIAKKQSDSLNVLLGQKIVELESCKKNGTQNDADVEKLKKCEDNNALLKAEMLEMTKTINRLNTKNYALGNRVDSLVNELKNCCKNCSTGNSGNDELLKKCQSSNAELNAEIVKLKSNISAKDKSLDSMKTIASDLNKKQVELNAQISKLNSDINELKGKSSDCSEIQKQLDEKTAEANKLKTENTTLQNQVKTITAQLNEYKTEYNFMVKQNQKCNMKLDSCMRGLYNGEPKAPGGTDGDKDGGPSAPDTDQGSIEEDEKINSVETEDTETAENDSSTESESTTASTEEKPMIGLQIGAKILGAIIESAVNSGGSGKSSSGRKSTSTTTSGNTGNSTAGTGKTTTTKRPTETSTSGSTGGSGSSGNTSGSGKTGNTNTSGNSGSSATTGGSTSTGSGSTTGRNSTSTSGSGNSGSSTGSGSTVKKGTSGTDVRR